MKKLFLVVILLLSIPLIANGDNGLEFVGNGWKYNGCYLDVIDFTGDIEKALSSDSYRNAKIDDEKHSKLKYWVEYKKWLSSTWCKGNIEEKYEQYLYLYHPEELRSDNKDTPNLNPDKENPPIINGKPDDFNKNDNSSNNSQSPNTGNSNNSGNRPNDSLEPNNKVNNLEDTTVSNDTNSVLDKDSVANPTDKKSDSSQEAEEKSDSKDVKIYNNKSVIIIGTIGLIFLGLGAYYYKHKRK